MKGGEHSAQSSAVFSPADTFNHFLDSFSGNRLQGRGVLMIDSMSDRGNYVPACIILLRDTSRRKRGILNLDDSLWRYSMLQESCS